MAWKLRGRSSLRLLQHRLELTRIAAMDKEAVRIMALGQRDRANIHPLLSEPAGKRLRRLLTTTVRVGIKNQIDDSHAVAELAKLACVEMVSHRAGDVVVTCLPQHCRREPLLDRGGLAPMHTSRPWCPARTDAGEPKPTGCGHRGCLPGETRCGVHMRHNRWRLPNRLDTKPAAGNPTASASFASDRRARSQSACARSVPTCGFRVGTGRRPPRCGGVTECDRISWFRATKALDRKSVV